MKTLPIWMPTVQDFLHESVWIEEAAATIGTDMIEQLAMDARDIRANSYAPYSKYHVGVAILTTSSKVYTGVNAERASYSETDHAEESAITSAIIGGEIARSGRRFIKAVAVSHAGTSAPCGRCRQIIAEHADNALIVLADPDAHIHSITSLKSILPLAFTPTDLGIS